MFQLHVLSKQAVVCEVNYWCSVQGLFRIYPLPPDPNEPLPMKVFDNLPTSAPQECLVRVYIIKAIDLQPNDSSGLVSTSKHFVTAMNKLLPNILKNFLLNKHAMYSDKFYKAL